MPTVASCKPEHRIDIARSTAAYARSSFLSHCSCGCGATGVALCGGGAVSRPKQLCNRLAGGLIGVHVPPELSASTDANGTPSLKTM